MFEAVGISLIEVAESILSTRTNEAVVPRNFVIARAATKISNRFKKFGLYRVLEFARQTPIYNLVFGSQHTPSDHGVDAKSRSQLRNLLAKDYAFLADRYGIHYPEIGIAKGDIQYKGQ